MNRPIPYNGNEPFIFISYSHKDSDIVWPLISRMINDGYRVWYDDGINPGTNWDEVIAEKIKKCGYFIAFISKNYIESDNCKDELNYARDQVENKFIVYLEDTTLPTGLDMRIGRIQAIKIYECATEESFYSKLYNSQNIENFRGNVSCEIIEESIDSLIEDQEVVAPKRVDVKRDIKPTIKNKKAGISFNKLIMTILYVFSVLFILIVVADIVTSIGTKYADFDVPRGIYLIIGYVLIFLFSTNFKRIQNRIFKLEKKPLWFRILIVVLVDILIAALMFMLLVGTEVLLIIN